MKTRVSLQRVGQLSLLAALVACDRGPLNTNNPAGQAQPEQNAQLVRAGADSIPGRYIVVFNAAKVTNPAAVARQMVAQSGGTLHFTYEHALRGFAASLGPNAVEALLRNPQVAFVEQDRRVEMTTTQSPATWGLDRIDQRLLPLNNAYNYTATGAGVTAYVIDSGILTTHTQFGGRASVGIDLIGDGQNGQDCNGHGTHVSGTIGGSTYGVAKAVNLVAVRVFACSGGTPTSTIIAGIDWVTAHAVHPAVVNMSLGGSASAAEDSAVQRSIASGITYVVAAGNEDVDACTKSPARAPNAITVGATATDDARSDFSNWGSCLDLFAPGSDITSAWWTSTTATNTISGTSMASPHVAGVAALFLQGNPAATPANVTNAILNSATEFRVTDLKGSVNRLLFSPLTVEALRLNAGALSFMLFSPSGTPGSTDAATATAPLRWSTTTTPKQLTSVSDANGVAGMSASTAPEVGIATTSSKPVVLTNRSGASVTWAAASNRAWLTVGPTGGTLAAGASTTLTVTVNTTGLSGVNSGQITVTGGGSTLQLPVTLTVGTSLSSGVPVTGLASSTFGEEKYFAITVPGGADSLVVTTDGPNGDADLYVSRGVIPTASTYDCGSLSSSSVENCLVTSPPGDTYYIMVRTFSAYSSLAVTATLYGLAPPAAPTHIAVTGAGAGRASITWDDNSGNETRFEIRRSLRNSDGTFAPLQTVGIRGVNSTRFLDSTLVIGSTYRYKVQACNTFGCTASSFSALITAAVPPTAPSGLAATVVSARRVNLTWTDNSTNETSFRVRRATRNFDGTYGAYSIRGTLGANQTTFADSTTAADNRYRYVVDACNGGGCVSSATITVTIPALPSSPYGLAGTVVSATRVNLTWYDVSTNETSHRVRRSTRNPDGTFGEYVLLATIGANRTAYADPTVSVGNRYRYRVEACNAAGCATSTAIGVLVPLVPTAPSGVELEAISGDFVSVTWVDNSNNEESFQVLRGKRNADGTYTAWTTIASLPANWTDYGDSTTPSTTYRYRVLACNVSGCASSSGKVVTTPP